MTSGGTESILSAMLSSLAFQRENRGIVNPEILIADSAHAAYFKAASYSGAKCASAYFCSYFTVLSLAFYRFCCSFFTAVFSFKIMSRRETGCVPGIKMLPGTRSLQEHTGAIKRAAGPPRALGVYDTVMHPQPSGSLPCTQQYKVSTTF